MKREQARLEILWDDLLSEQPETIRTAFAALDKTDQNMVLTHLERMASEEGWQPGQRRSALAALKAIKDQEL